MLRSITSSAIFFLLLTSSVSATSAPGLPRRGHEIFKRDSELSCPSNRLFDSVCAADDGTSICHDRLHTCCQLPDLKTPYSCGWGHAHCCGTDTPTCGSDPSCKNLKGGIDVAPAVSAPAPSTVAAAPTGTGTQVVVDHLATVTAKKNPNATGGVAGMAVRKGEGALVVVAAAMALL